MRGIRAGGEDDPGGQQEPIGQRSCSVRSPGCPARVETDDIESRLFDLTALKMQLALAEGDIGTFERHRRRVVETAILLEEKSTIPAVTAQLAYLASVQESAFWKASLEELRMRLRGLAPFLDKKTRKVVYTDFRDKITACARTPPSTCRR